MTRRVGTTGLFTCIAVVLAQTGAAVSRVTVDQLLAHLTQNTSVLRTIVFTATVTSSSIRPDPGLTRVSRFSVRVFVDFRNNELRQEMLDPPLGLIGKGEDEEGPEQLLMHSGLPAEIMDPVGSLRGFRLTLASSAPSGFAVVRVQPGMAPPGPFPRCDWLVDTEMNRLVSVTVYAGTGEVAVRTGFEAYVEFLDGQVVLPTRVVVQEFARLNRIETLRTYDQIAVTTSGKTAPTTGAVDTFLLETAGSALSGIFFSLTVTALGEGGKVLSGYEGTIAFTSTDGIASLPVSYRFRKADQGSHVFSIALATQGQQVVTVEGAQGRNGAVSSVMIDVAPAQQYIVVRGARTLNGLDFFGSSSGWAVGSTTDFSEPLIMHFDGASWGRVLLPVPSGCAGWTGTAVSLADPATGWIGTKGAACAEGVPPGLLYPIAGGSVGFYEPDPPLTSSTGLAMLSVFDGWEATFHCTDGGCVAGTGEMRRYDGSGWWLVQELGLNEALSNLRFAGGLSVEGWAIGSTRLWRYRDAQGQWNATDQPGTLSLWMNSPADVWAGSFGASLWHFDGNAWTQAPVPADPHFAISGIAFSDPGHGVAVGFLAGFLQTQLPVVLQYTNGAWQLVPVSLPAGFANLRLIDVRMPSPDEAWATAAGFDLQGGVLDQPVLVRLALPQTSAVAAPAASAAVVAILAEAARPEITSFEVTAPPVGGRGIDLGFGVGGRCEAELTILSESMRQVWTRTLSAASSAEHVNWDGRDTKGEVAASGWYTAALVVRSSAGSATEVRRFHFARPRSSSVAMGTRR